MRPRNAPGPRPPISATRLIPAQDEALFAFLATEVDLVQLLPSTNYWVHPGYDPEPADAVVW
jgi:hypothetical protein